MGKVNQESVPEILGRPERHLLHQPQSERDQSQRSSASPHHQEEELDVSLQCGGWYVLSYKRYYKECLAEEEENIGSNLNAGEPGDYDMDADYIRQDEVSNITLIGLM